MSTLSSRIGRGARALLCLSLFVVCAGRAGAQEPQATPTPQQPAASQAAPPQTNDWSDTFDGDKLDEAKWERYTFEGGSGG